MAFDGNDTARAVQADASTFARLGDNVLLGSLGGGWLMALALGSRFGATGLAAMAGGTLFAAGLAAWRLGRGTLATRLVLAVAAMAMVALHIQLGRGMIEMHFGVFVLLALLLVYRDWRPVVAAAAAIAVHHLLFDRLQALGFPLFCTPQADLPVVLLHAGYVVVQTGIEVYAALNLARAAREGAELRALVAHVERGERLDLDLSAAAPATPGGQALHRALLRIGEAITAVDAAARQLAGTSGELAAGNRALRERTERQAGRVEHTTGSMAQLGTAVGDNAATANQADGLAASACDAARQGGEVVGQVVATMDGIAAASRRIGEITGTIDGIAFQTNILALNAAVEAARAGEQGRGFAVVAGEVRSLAQRAAEAARQIKQLSGDSAERVHAGSRLVHDAGQSMAQIVGQVQRVSVLIRDISQATQAQAGELGAVQRAVAELDDGTRQNAVLVNQGADAAEAMHAQVDRLRAVVGQFRLGAPPA